MVIGHDFHDAPQLSTRHAVGPDQFRGAAGAAQIDLGLSIAEGVNVGRLVIVHEDDDPYALGAENSNHLEDNPTRLVFKTEVEIDFRPISHF